MLRMSLGAASLFLTLVLPGYGFLYMPNAQTSQVHASTKREDASDLSRRYWNDETAVCIKKYCQIYQKTNDYTSCLRVFCPEAVATLPATRDLGAVADDGGLTSGMALASLPLLSTSSVCVSMNCLGQFGQSFEKCSRKCGVEAGDVGQHREITFSLTQLLHDLCKQTLCSEADAESYGRCLMERCVRGVGNRGDKGTVTKRKALARKRRINDPVSQCIQSYCGDKNFDTKTRRMICIVTKCHRPTG